MRIIPDSFELVPNNVPDVSASASLGSQRGGSQPRCVQMSAIENIAGGNIAEAVFKLFTISATGKAAYFRPSPSLAMLLKRVAHNVPAVIPFSQPPVALTRVAFLSHRSYYLIGDFENFEISPLLSFFRDATFVLNENSFNSQICRKDRSRINCRKILDFDLSENKKTIVNEKLYVKFFFLA